MSRNSVLAQALQLPPEERADMAKLLISSLDESADEDVESAWHTEVERRLLDLNANDDAFEPWDVVRARVATRLRRSGTSHLHRERAENRRQA